MKTLDLGDFSKQLGWSLSGVCAAEISQEAQAKTQTWLQEFKGPQMNYLVRRSKERLDPKTYFPEAKTTLAFGLYYFPGWALGDVKVSNYAWGEDYHSVLKEKLEATAKALVNELGDFDYRISVDTAPVLEKTIAVQAGLGWQGKNSLVINPKLGSLFFLGEIFTSLPLSQFSATMPVADHCGTCTRCIDACPTDALSPYVLDASKCISYWTLEHKGEFDKSTPKFSNWVAGCDICQEVCPWNQKLIPIPSPEPSPFQNLKESDIRAGDWNERIKNSATSYIAKENWKRNLDHLDH